MRLHSSLSCESNRTAAVTAQNLLLLLFSLQTVESLNCGWDSIFLLITSTLNGFWWHTRMKRFLNFLSRFFFKFFLFERKFVPQSGWGCILAHRAVQLKRGETKLKNNFQKKWVFNKNYNINNKLTLLQFLGCSTPSSQVSPREQQWRNRMPLAQVLAFLFPNPGLDWDSLMRAGSLRSPTRWWSPDSAATRSFWWLCTFWESLGCRHSRVCVFSLNDCMLFYLQLDGKYLKSCRDWLIPLIEKQQLPQGLLKRWDPLQFAGERVLLTFSNSVSQDTQSDNIFCSITDWRGGTLCDYVTWRHN